MKKTKISSLAWIALLRPACTALVLLLCGAFTPASAMPIGVGFSFQDVNNGGGMVTGIIRGVLDNATSSAISVEITGNGNGGYGLGEYFQLPVSIPNFNTFVLAGGTVVEASFLSYFSSIPTQTGMGSLMLAHGGTNYGRGWADTRLEP